MISKKLKKCAAMAITASIFIMLLIFSGEAVAGAAEGMALCANVIVPTLLPFFVLSDILCSMGLPGYLGRLFDGAFCRLFGVGGAGAAAFILGLTGGYPLGAKSVGELYRSGEISQTEARHLALFCNNSGPAFIIGMAGIGICHSAGIGVLFYIAHGLAALAVGILLCRKTEHHSSPKQAICTLELSEAISAAMTRAVKSTAMICGFIIFFSMLSGIFRTSGLLGELVLLLCSRTPLSVTQARAMLLGLMELGGGISAMGSLGAEPINLAICSFLLGWGGLSVHFQTASVLSGYGLKSRGMVAAKLLHGILAGGITYLFALII